MAKTLKQILDGVKSSKTKTKDILGNQPGVDYSPKAGDERKFADKHKIEVHADRVGNGDDVYNATNVKQDTTARHGHKSREDEKVYEEFEIDENYFNDAPARDSFDSHGSTANFHAETARQHAIAALVHTKTKEHDKAKKHQAAAEAHQKADLAHAIAGYHHSSRHVSRHDSSIAAHKASKEANKLSDIAHNIGIKHFKEEAVKEAVAKCNMSGAGKKCDVHGMKACTPGQVKEESDDGVDLSESRKIDSKSVISPRGGEDRYELHHVGSGKGWHSIVKTHQDGQQLPFHNVVHVGNEKYVQKMWKGIKHATVKAAGPVSEESAELEEFLIQNYVSGQKNKRAEVHKVGEDYTVKKYNSAHGGDVVATSKHEDAGTAHATAKKHISEDAEELDEKAAIAKSKQTVLVTAKGTKSAGGVMRIKKSDYDPKKHDLAEDEEINEISKGKAIKTYAQAGSAGDYGMTDKTFSQGERLLGHIKRKFGDEAGKHAEKAASAAYWGRGTPTPGKDSLTPHVKMRVTASGKVNKQDVVSKKKEIKSRLGVKEETEIEERKMSDAEMNKREKIVKGMKKKLSDFRARYGERAKDVMYATATKQAMKEDLAQPLLGSADAKKKKTQSSPAVTPNTLPNFNVDVNTGRNV